MKTPLRSGPMILTVDVNNQFRFSHSDYAETLGVGETPALAAANLVNLIARGLDHELAGWQREAALHAIDDVRSYAEAVVCRLPAQTD
jgi:hypothetical protein